MSIYRPSELLEFLESLGIRPKKALSQNFLIDQNILKKIIQTADVKPGDLVVEIGPGPGSMTELLLDAGAHVIAIEKDRTLAAALERLKTPERHLEVFQMDVMDFPFEELIKRPAKVVANLPYNLTSPILIKLLPMRHLLTYLHVMVQEEVGRRLTALPRTPDYGSLSIYVRFYSKPTYAFTISNKCFFPSPKVQSAWITMELQDTPEGVDPEAFFKITRRAFEQRRKMMRSSLRDLYGSEEVTAALEKVSLNPLARPEDLSLEDFVKFYHAIVKV